MLVINIEAFAESYLLFFSFFFRQLGTATCFHVSIVDFKQVNEQFYTQKNNFKNYLCYTS